MRERLLLTLLPLICEVVNCCQGRSKLWGDDQLMESVVNLGATIVIVF
jgi:hypothetical protein